MTLRPTLLATLLCAATLGGGAQATEPGDVIFADLLSGWREPSGQRIAALRLTLAPDWKTYWRAPGDAGIPPMFDWTGSENLKSVRFHWPRPQVETINGMQSIGYHDQLVLPFEVVAQDASQPVVLRLKVDLGVCDDICIPATVAVTGRLDGDGAPDGVISAALKARPATAREAGLGAMQCEVEPIKDGLRLTARMRLPAQGPEEAVVFEPGQQGVWVAQSDIRREGGDLVAVTEMVPPQAAPFALDRSAMTVTVLGAKGAVEIAGCPAP